MVSQNNLFIEREEAERILQSVGVGEEKYRLLLLLVLNGCRPCEAVALHVSDFIKPDCTQFFVNNSKVVRKGAVPRRDLKVVPKWLGEELRHYIEQCYNTGLLRGGFLFSTNKPSKFVHMQADSLGVWFARRRKVLGLMEEAGLRRDGRPRYRVQLYSFRRLLATSDAERGVPLHLIAARMGHLDTKTTVRYVDRKKLFALLPSVVEGSPLFLEPCQKRLTEIIAAL